MAKKSRRDEATAEDVRKSLEMAENPPSPLDRSELKARIAGWRKEWAEPQALMLDLKDMLDEPTRVALFLPDDGIIDRAVLIFDKASGEILEHKARGVRILSKLGSRQGLDAARLTRDAEEWLRAQRSGRVLKSDGSIV
jgi:hypothetical protein